eukprot:m.9336 g.9336  ORF g.9336 m.9336 type:complete len:174 (+) comp21274_c0_seq1:53-574(+)
MLAALDSPRTMKCSQAPNGARRPKGCFRRLSSEKKLLIIRSLLQEATTNEIAYASSICKPKPRCKGRSMSDPQTGRTTKWDRGRDAWLALKGCSYLLKSEPETKPLQNEKKLEEEERVEIKVEEMELDSRVVQIVKGMFEEHKVYLRPVCKMLGIDPSAAFNQHYLEKEGEGD